MHREVHRRDELVLVDRRRQVVLEQVGRRDVARAAAPAGHGHRPLGRQQDRRHVRGRVAVGERAAQRPAVAHLLVGDRRRDHRGQAQVAGRHLVMRRHRADAGGPVVALDAGQLADPAQVHQQRRRRQPQLHQRQQRVAAGEELRVLAAVAQRAQRRVERLGSDVVELGAGSCPTSLARRGRSGAGGSARRGRRAPCPAPSWPGPRPTPGPPGSPATPASASAACRCR